MKAKLVPWGSEGQRLRFWCEGCKESHAIPVNSAHGWQWNGDMEKPTITPSVLVRSGHYVPGHNSDSCWCTYNAAHPEDHASFKCYVCHMFVTDGNALYMNDCTHELAGQIVHLPDLDEIEEEAT